MQRLVNGVKQFASGGGSTKSALFGKGVKGLGLPVMAAKNVAARDCEAMGLYDGERRSGGHGLPP
jgi:hypothetical protein